MPGELWNRIDAHVKASRGKFSSVSHYLRLLVERDLADDADDADQAFRSLTRLQFDREIEHRLDEEERQRGADFNPTERAAKKEELLSKYSTSGPPHAKH